MLFAQEWQLIVFYRVPLVRKDSVNTIGMEFGTRIIHIADKDIKLQIWDTAGQVRKGMQSVWQEKDWACRGRFTWTHPSINLKILILLFRLGTI